MLVLLVDCLNFLILFRKCNSINAILQIEILFFTLIIIVIMIAIVDNESNTIREKINNVFNEY
jgi:ABC-type phosphate/phosphonate transport system permease subunit